MNVEKQLFPTLTPENLMEVEKVEAFIKTNWNIGYEKYRLLYDGIQALKNNLFFATFWIFWTFLEKSLRDELIMLEYKNGQKNQPTNEELFIEYDRIEELIEDWDEEKKQKYSFPTICKELVAYNFLSKQESTDFIDFYKKERIPTHHWIYRRRVKDLLWDHQIQVFKSEFKEWTTAEDFLWQLKEAMSWKTNTSRNNSNVITRVYKLPELMKSRCLTLLTVIESLIDRFNWIEK